jgi:nitroreductase
MVWVVSERSASAVLAEAAEVAGYAPSVHNTQPWRWRINAETMDLLADRERQLAVADPQGRLLTISCGAALHHATVALAAEGWQAKLRCLDGPDHLARITLGPHLEATPEVTAEAMRHLQAIRVRHTDRRPVGGTPITTETVDVLRSVAAAYGIDVHLLTPDQVVELGAASAQADRIELLDPQQRQELNYWIGGERPEGTGIPDSALPEEPTGGPIPGRDFVRAGTLPTGEDTGEGTDRAASYAVLFGMGDEPADWLRAGEALSACWLAATERGVSVLPFSAVIEVPATREVLRRLLSGIGYPYLVLRLGIAPDDRPGPPHTPRVPAQQLIEIAKAP